nr:type VI secretion system-associated protein VasI [uncultured Moellerella sp.]
MKCLLLSCVALTSLFISSAGQADEVESAESQIQQVLEQCRLESSPLVRLDCYDKLGSATDAEAIQAEVEEMGVIWQQARDHEAKRDDNSANFITTQSANGGYPVIMTTPAIGAQSPRPILMISCIDNITRMQLVLSSVQEAGAITLTSDQIEYSADWFLRENGYVLESSRGIPGIEEIKRLLSGNRLTIKLANDQRLSFNISQLAEDIKPLRAACHW